MVSDLSRSIAQIKMNETADGKINPQNESAALCDGTEAIPAPLQAAKRTAKPCHNLAVGCPAARLPYRPIPRPIPRSAWRTRASWRFRPSSR